MLFRNTGTFSIAKQVLRTYVVSVEAASHRRGHVEVPVPLVVAQHVRKVVGVEPQRPEPGEQRAARHVEDRGDGTGEAETLLRPRMVDYQYYAPQVR